MPVPVNIMLHTKHTFQFQSTASYTEIHKYIAYYRGNMHAQLLNDLFKITMQEGIISDSHIRMAHSHS